MLAIVKREFKSYFQNVIGWLFVAALLAVYGLYFYVYNLKNGYPYISYDLNGIGFIMMIAVPILTMRSLSDEKKDKDRSANADIACICRKDCRRKNILRWQQYTP